jgi:hypothetical protein
MIFVIIIILQNLLIKFCLIQNYFRIIKTWNRFGY